ncbi:MAG: hypothetical protein ABR909_13775 [Candidatus Bathyarchaeia archaeon]
MEKTLLSASAMQVPGKLMDLDLKVPPAEVVDVGQLRVDGCNPNRLGKRQFKALKESIKRLGFVVPIVTNKDLLVADGGGQLLFAISFMKEKEKIYCGEENNN